MRVTIGDPEHEPMREDEWRTWCDPREMLEFLRGAVDDRKLRLFGIGWVQTLPEYIDACYGVKTGDYGMYLQRGTRFPFTGSELVASDNSQILKCMATLVNAVEVAELFVEGQAGAEELGAAHKAAAEVSLYLSGHDESNGDLLLSIMAAEVSQESAYRAAFAARTGLLRVTGDVTKDYPEELKTGCDILRDVFGNPFRPFPAVVPSVLSWNAGSVQRLAKSIYEKRCFDQMPALGDSLEEAGCSDSDILSHCRGPRGHVRGCWLVDLLLRRD